MKSILLFSSIFYILGLKIGHKIDFFKNASPVEKITTITNPVKQASKTINFKDQVQHKCDTVLLKNATEINKITKEETHF